LAGVFVWRGSGDPIRKKNRNAEKKRSAFIALTGR
jgi:hypothetical protein